MKEKKKKIKKKRKKFLLVNPGFNRHTVFGKRPTFQQLVNAIHRQMACQSGVQTSCNWDLSSMGCDHLQERKQNNS